MGSSKDRMSALRGREGKPMKLSLLDRTSAGTVTSDFPFFRSMGDVYASAISLWDFVMAAHNIT